MNLGPLKTSVLRKTICFDDSLRVKFIVVRKVFVKSWKLLISLSFKAHIQEICRKVNKKVSILRRIRKFIPSDIMIKLCKAFILLHFEYASPLFIGLSKGLSAKLESTNAFALRTLLNYSKSTAYGELLKTTYQKLGTSTHWTSTDTRIQQHL